MNPSLQELESVCQKPRWREVGSWLARRVARPAALYVTWFVVRVPLSANAVTAFTLVVGLTAAMLIGLGQRSLFLAGAAVLNFWYLLDHVDGQVARFHRRESVTGVYFDFMMHHVVHAAVAFSLGYGLARQSGELAWSLAGAALALGVTALSLANDCRYKAFYSAEQKGGGRRAEGGGPEGFSDAFGQSFSAAATASRRPTVEARTPAHRALRSAIRVGQKLCEMPNVIIAMTVLAGVVALHPRLGFQIVQGYLLLMSILAPVLAVARVAKQVWLCQPDTDFHSFTAEKASGLTPRKPASE